MIDISRYVPAVGAVDGPPVVKLEQIFCIQPIGLLVRDSFAPILDNELSSADRHDRENAKARSRPADTEHIVRG
jgi:hypothetical protein